MRIFEGRSLASGWKTVNLLKEPGLTVGTATDGAATVGATTVREWLLRADQSIRANRLLTRAAQGGAGGFGCGGIAVPRQHSPFRQGSHFTLT